MRSAEAGRDSSAGPPTDAGCGVGFEDSPTDAGWGAGVDGSP